MRLIALTVGILTGLTGFPLPRADAWNGTGHKTVAKLAWDRLDARQRKAVYALLEQHPHVKEFFAKQPRPNNVAEPEWYFLLASTWADWLRGFTRSERPEDKAIAAYHKGPRHYINLPIVNPADADAFKNKKLDPPPENIVTALPEYIAQLRDPNGAAADKAVALCWLLHLIGDIHQPLHCVAFFSVKEYPEGDLGGNLRWVKNGKEPTNLHAYWDDLPGRSSGYEQVKSNVEILTRADYARDKYALELARVEFMQWAEEGAALARKHAYRNGELSGLMIPLGEATAAKKQTAPALPDDYGANALSVGRRQLALAGHRLSDQLDALFPKKAD
jgi:hypothetical protein